jgi:hypothetical protein
MMSISGDDDRVVGYDPNMLRIPLNTAMVLIVLATCACAPYRQQDPAFLRERSDIHERLSEVLVRDGFSHDLQSRRDDLEHLDVIRVRLSLDSVKGRHYSLEKLMADIGRICSLPAYAHLPIRIVIMAADEGDQMYLYALLATATRGSRNISVASGESTRNEIGITVRHPGRGGS